MSIPRDESPSHPSNQNRMNHSSENDYWAQQPSTHSITDHDPFVIVDVPTNHYHSSLAIATEQESSLDVDAEGESVTSSQLSVILSQQAGARMVDDFNVVEHNLQPGAEGLGESGYAADIDEAHSYEQARVDHRGRYDSEDFSSSDESDSCIDVRGLFFREQLEDHYDYMDVLSGDEERMPPPPFNSPISNPSLDINNLDMDSIISLDKEDGLTPAQSQPEQEKPKLFKCDCCWEEFDAGRLSISHCPHSFCTACLIKILDIALVAPNRYPPHCCQKPVEVDFNRHLLSKMFRLEYQKELMLKRAL